MRIANANENYETWRNVTDGRVVIRKFSLEGKLVEELVGGQRQFHITPHERRINQEAAADENMDHFSNGIFVPVKLLDGDEDIEKIKSNPNHIGESDMKQLLTTRNAKSFQSKVEKITNPITLKRLLELAKDEDATVRQVEVIHTRLKTVAPSLATEVTTVGGVATPRPPTPERPRPDTAHLA